MTNDERREKTDVSRAIVIRRSSDRKFGPMAKIIPQKITLMAAGYCTHPEFVTIRGGQRRRVPYPALFALLEHPEFGPVLFDTGYTPRFFNQTKRWPYSLYTKITPVYLDAAKTAANQIQARGIASADVRYVIISHFHADHVGGLADFPNAQYIYLSEAFNAVRRLRGFSAVKAGFLPGLLPPDFEQRSRPIEVAASISLPAQYAPFDRGFDLFGDGRLLGVHLPGHAHGQLGLFLDAENMGPTLLAADACWHSRAYRELAWPHPLANLALADANAYRDTLQKLAALHQRRPDLHILPTHCRDVWERYVEP